MDNKPMVLIRKNYNTLSDRQRIIADYLLQHTSQIEAMTISVLANSCDTTVTTVMRFINKLGYQSYRTFHMDLLKELTSTLEPTVQEDGYQNIIQSDTMEQIKCKVARSASAAIFDLPKMLHTQELEEAAELLFNANHILFYGVGGSNIIAMDAYQKFMRLGFSVYCDANSHFALVRSIRMTSSDVLLLISHKGESREVLECAVNAKESGGKTIAITSYPKSTLSKLADITLLSSTYSSHFYTDAMVSRLIQLTILDMLFVGVSLRMGNQSTQQISLSRHALKASKRFDESTRAAANLEEES